MRNLFRVLSILSTVLCLGIFLLIYFVEINVPEKLTTVENSSLNRVIKTNGEFSFKKKIRHLYIVKN